MKNEIRNTRTDYSEANIVITNTRHFECLNRAYDTIINASSGLQEQMPLEIVSAEIRVALVALEEIVGKTYTEDILGKIFSKFCNSTYFFHMLRIKK